MEKRYDLKKNVILLGFHKSGTSATAGLLSILGVHMGEKLRSADGKNPKGYFEDMEILRLNTQILKDAGGDAWSPPISENILKQKSKYDKRILDFIERKNKRYDIWGWKVTTTCLTAELYYPYLKNPHFVVVFRNPIGAAKSAIEHTEGKINFLDAISLANYYNEQLAEFLKRHPDSLKCYVSFEKMINQPVEEAEKIARFLDVEFTETHVRRIEKFIISRSNIRKEKSKAKICYNLRNPIKQLKALIK